MSLYKKAKRIKFLTAAAVIVCMLSACGNPAVTDTSSSSPGKEESTSGTKAEEQKSEYDIPADSILNFDGDKAFARLQSDMESGDIPVECNVLYDVGGARPDVTVSDVATIREIYKDLAKIKVGKVSDVSVTDSYHHVCFRLTNDTYVSFYFEGEDLFCWGRENYNIAGGDDLWRVIRQLQDVEMEKVERKAEQNRGQASSTSDTSSGSSASNTGSSDSAASKTPETASAGSTENNGVEGDRSEDTYNDRDLMSSDDRDPSGGMEQSGREEEKMKQDNPSASDDGSDNAKVSDGGRGKNVSAGELSEAPAVTDGQDSVAGNTPEQSAQPQQTTQDETQTAGDTTADSGQNEAQPQTDDGSSYETPSSENPAADNADGQTQAAEGTGAAEGTDGTDSSENGEYTGDDTQTEAGSGGTVEAAAEAGTVDPAQVQQPPEAEISARTETAYSEIVRDYAEALTWDKDAFMKGYEEGLYGGSAAASENADGYTGESPDAETEKGMDEESENPDQAADENAEGGEDDADETAAAGGTAEPPAYDDRLNYELLREYFMNPQGRNVVFGLKDYNEDEVPELVIALEEQGHTNVFAVFTFDGNKAVQLFTGKLTLAYRVNLFVLDDGTFLVHGSGGATSGSDTICRIADGAGGLEIIAEYEYDEVLNGSTDHISKSGERLTDEEFNERYKNTSDPAADISFTPVGEAPQFGSGTVSAE